ncbi:hypothetical protein DFH27DRAFT_612190 [Peziza echinospora]|nr:hypothetical protein DFH27DRAFT_612190 [Peziza echinospora]
MSMMAFSCVVVAQEPPVPEAAVWPVAECAPGGSRQDGPRTHAKLRSQDQASELTSQPAQCQPREASPPSPANPDNPHHHHHDHCPPSLPTDETLSSLTICPSHRRG